MRTCTREDPSLINIIAWLHRDITRRCPTVFKDHTTYHKPHSTLPLSLSSPHDHNSINYQSMNDVKDTQKRERWAQKKYFGSREM
jgi:hypothetical protein